jgi:hypothetical protein
MIERQTNIFSFTRRDSPINSARDIMEGCGMSGTPPTSAIHREVSDIAPLKRRSTRFVVASGSPYKRKDPPNLLARAVALAGLE